MRKLLFLAILLAVGSPLWSQSIPAGSKIFIAPMEGNLNGFITAEILKQHLNVLLVADDTQADLVMTGMNVKEDDHWYNAVWGGKDKNEGSVTLVRVKDKAIVWAMDAGDRSMFFSVMRRGGLSKVADRIVGQMKHQVAKK